MVNEEPGGAARKPRQRPLRWLIGILVIAAVAVIWWQAVKTPRGLGLLETLPPLLQELPKDEQRIGQIILDNYQEYRRNARNWSAVYFGCLFFSAVCAAVAGLVIKLELFLKNDSLKKDLAAVLAMVSALLITLSSVGGFHQRWWANRLAAAKMEKLAYAFMTADRKANPEAFSSQLQSISYERNEEIVSNESERSKTTNQNKTELPKPP